MREAVWVEREDGDLGAVRRHLPTAWTQHGDWTAAENMTARCAEGGKDDTERMCFL